MLEKQLLQHLNQFQASPFLFVGSGLSQRYLGLDDWEGLLKRFAQELPKPLTFYKSSADGSLPRTASLLADDFHSFYWESDQYEVSRLAHGHDFKDRSSALKVAITDYILSQDLSVCEKSHDEEISLLKQANIDGIITTNYDLLLERLFPDYQVYVGQNQLIFSQPQAIAEIYKIHGSVTDPNSLVLTESDYAAFNQRNAYLAAKLLTVFVEHPVIFLGYSMSDPDIKSLVMSIAQCLDEGSVDQLKDRLIFVNWVRGLEVGEFQTYLLQLKGETLPVKMLRLDSFVPLYRVLGMRKRQIPARLLRLLKAQVSDLVRSQDPGERLYAVDLDASSDTANLEVVFGVGIRDSYGRQGYTSITRDDLLEDVVFDSRKFDAKLVVEMVLPRIVNGQTQVPVFKYLRAAGVFDDSPSFEMPSKIANCLLSAFKRYRGEVVPDSLFGGDSLREIAEKNGIEFVLKRFKLFSDESLSVTSLRDFLIAYPRDRTRMNAYEVSRYAKMVCLLDCLEFAPEDYRR